MKVYRTTTTAALIISFIIVFLVLVSAVMIALCGTASAELYPETARVVEVNYDEDMVTVETFNGFLFVFEGCEDYAEGDGVAMIMDDNGTEKVFDDIILMVQYCGWDLVNWYTGE